MKYLISIYPGLAKHSDDRFTIQNSLQCPRIEEFVTLALLNVRAFKTVTLKEERALIVSRHSFIISNAASFCAFRLLREYGQRRLYIYEFHVLPEQQRRGVGQELLNKIFRLALSLGLRHVALTVDTNNAAGAAFWAKNGFRTAPENVFGKTYKILLRKL